MPERVGDLDISQDLLIERRQWRVSQSGDLFASVLTVEKTLSHPSAE